MIASLLSLVAEEVHDQGVGQIDLNWTFSTQRTRRIGGMKKEMKKTTQLGNLEKLLGFQI